MDGSHVSSFIMAKPKSAARPPRPSLGATATQTRGGGRAGRSVGPGSSAPRAHCLHEYAAQVCTSFMNEARFMNEALHVSSVRVPTSWRSL